MINDLLILLELYPNKNWNYEWLSLNTNIIWEIVKNNPNKPWDYYYLSLNPNITWEIVKNNSDKPWDFYGLSWNEFKKNKYVKSKLLLKKYFYIWLNKYKNNIKIKNYWKNIYYCCLHELNMKYEDVMIRELKNISPKLIY